MRLPIAEIYAIGDVTNGKHPDICLSSPKFNKSKVSSVDDMMCIVDCRVYKDFLNTTSLKSSKTFMNVGSDDIGRDAQVNTICRAERCVVTVDLNRFNMKTSQINTNWLVMLLKKK